MLSEWLSDLRYRLRVLFHREDVERELDDELRFHLEHEAAKYARDGMRHDDAMRRARLAFGGVEQMKEASRDRRGTTVVETLAQDVRYAVRSLGSRPAFTIVVIGTLAIGIGANTAVFTLVDALMLRTLPVAQPEQLVAVGDASAVNSGWHGSAQTDYQSYPVYVDLRDENTVLSDVYASGSIGDLDVSFDPADGNAIEHPKTRFVTSNFFNVLGVRAYAGGTFAPDGDRARRPDAALVLSYGFWQRRFASDRSIVGRLVRVNNVTMRIIGIGPPGFTGDVVGETPDVWVPMLMEPMLKRTNLIDDRAWSWLQIMGRLKPGVPLGLARAQLSGLVAQSIRAHLTGIHLSRFEEDLKNDPVRVEPAARGFSSRRTEYGGALVVLMVAVGLVALVVCANVSNLMLARAAARGAEMTVRMTLGAGRGRLVKQLLTESALIAVAGATFGLLGALWGSRLLLALAGDSGSPIALDVMPDIRVLAFTAATSLACAMLFGLAPAFRATRVDLATALRSYGRSQAGALARFGGMPMGKLLVVVQIALSMLLLIGTGVLARSMQNLLRANLGFDRDHLLAVSVEAGRSDYVGPRLANLRRDLAERVSRVPGVDAASYSVEGVFGASSGGHVTVPGFVAAADSDRQADLDYVGPGYFRSIGAHLLRGRDFAASDIETGAIGAINQTMANAYFRGRDPIGRTVMLDDQSFTIVAVVGDVQEHDVRGKPVRRLYMASNDPTPRPMSFELQVHVSGDPLRFIAPVREALRSADRTLPIEIEPVNQRVRATIAEHVLLTQVTSFFGVLALLLAALGLYGVTAYATAQRTSEFGVRLALGAKPGAVAAMVVREATVLAIAGVVVSIPIAIGLMRLIRGQIFGVSEFDPPSWTMAVVILILTAVMASYLPARRAARVGPLEALRGSG